MAISDVLKDKLKGMFSVGFTPRDDLLDPRDDYETRDKSLRAMRRMRRRQMDIVEKERLRKEMNEFKRRKDSKDFVGDSIIGPKKKKFVKQSFMSGDSYFRKGKFM